MEYTYKTKGTCSREISFEIDSEGRMRNVRFAGGCPGNTFGLALMCEGLPAREVRERLRGVQCRDRGTSCPDQLACAIDEALEN